MTMTIIMNVIAFAILAYWIVSDIKRKRDEKNAADEAERASDEAFDDTAK